MSLSLVSGGVSVAALTKHGHARRLSTPEKKKITFRGMGGGKGGVHRGVAQERHSMSPHHTPTPTPVREKSTFPKHGTSRPLSPPEEQALRKMGGGEQGGFTVALPKNDTASRLSPPRKTHHSCNGGGGEGGVHRGIAQAWHCTSPIPPLPPPHVRDN